ncbi:hypothetical protein [Kribbella alba]
MRRLFCHPVVQGHGCRLFPDGFSADLELTDLRGFDGGVTLAEYRTTS